MITYQVKLVERNTIKQFVETYHYSHSINGCITDYCFGLYDKEVLIGAMFYGKLAMANQWRKYASCVDDIIELRRLCCINETKKNTESFFIGYTLRWLKKNTRIKKVISYADPNYGHSGIIYKASNFSLIGRTAPGRIIIYQGKRYHDKTIRTTYKGQLKPFAKTIKEALLNGDAVYKKQLPKYVYLYSLRK